MTEPLEHSHDPADITIRLNGSNAASYLRDGVYGGIDGAVTTFAVVSGVMGASLSTKVILILGLANLLADGFSMAAANYSGTKAEIERSDKLRRMEGRHVDTDPEGEREEVRQILRTKGIRDDVLESTVDAFTANRAAWIDLMMSEEHGVSPGPPVPLRAAAVTFVAFMICGAVPLIPFLLLDGAAFQVSVAATAVTFFMIGAAKSAWSVRKWWFSGTETLVIGGVAALLSYLVGWGLSGLIPG